MTISVDGWESAAILGKRFFIRQGLMPGQSSPRLGFIREDIDNFPAPDFTNFNGGSLARSMSLGKFTPSGNPANFGWGLGASYSKVLMILGMTRMLSAFYVGISIGTAAAHATTGRQRGYHAGWEPNSVSSRLYKSDGVGGDNPLASDPTFLPPGATSPPASIALYVDGSIGRVIMFTRWGAEQWWPILDVTDGTYSAFQSVSIQMYLGGVQYFSVPLGVYAE